MKYYVVLKHNNPKPAADYTVEDFKALTAANPEKDGPKNITLTMIKSEADAIAAAQAKSTEDSAFVVFAVTANGHKVKGGKINAHHVTFDSAVHVEPKQVQVDLGEVALAVLKAQSKEEADKAAEVLGVDIRENLGFADGFFVNDKVHQLEVIKIIRKYQPDIVLANAVTDRHPDHGRGAQLVTDAGFLAGLRRIETRLNGEKQLVWRPKAIYHYIQFRNMKPDIVVDISDHYDNKMEAIKAHKSQFYNPDSNEPETVISMPGFLEVVTAKAREYGKQIGVKYAEGFTAERYLGVKNLFDLI